MFFYRDEPVCKYRCYFLSKNNWGTIKRRGVGVYFKVLDVIIGPSEKEIFLYFITNKRVHLKLSHIVVRLKSGLKML
jgi:hypothetical protein